MERELLSEVFMEGFREGIDHELLMKTSTVRLGIRKTVWVVKTSAMSKGVDKRQVWGLGISNSYVSDHLRVCPLTLGCCKTVKGTAIYYFLVSDLASLSQA